MGQAIDFTMNANGDHAYKVTNATEDNSTSTIQSNELPLFHSTGWGRKEF